MSDAGVWSAVAVAATRTISWKSKIVLTMLDRSLTGSQPMAEADSRLPTRIYVMNVPTPTPTDSRPVVPVPSKCWSASTQTSRSNCTLEVSRTRSASLNDTILKHPKSFTLNGVRLRGGQIPASGKSTGPRDLLAAAVPVTRLAEAVDRLAEPLAVVLPCSYPFDHAQRRIHVMNAREIVIRTPNAKATLFAFKGAGMYQFLGVKATMHPNPIFVSIQKISERYVIAECYLLVRMLWPPR